MKTAVVRRTVLVFGLGLVLPMAGRGAEDCVELPESLRARIQGDQDVQELYALDFVLAVGLTREQARAILPIYEQACRLSIEAYEKRAAFQPEMLEAFAAFLTEDRLNQGFSPEVERWTAGVNHRAKEARDKHLAEMIALEAQVGAILTPEQRQIAEEYKPGYQNLARKLAQQAERGGIAPTVHKRQPPKQKKRRTRLDEELAEAKRGLGELNASIHPRSGAIGRDLLTPAAARPLYEVAKSDEPKIVRDAFECWKEGSPAYPLTVCREDEEKIRRLRREINNWNLVNGLNLDRRQIRELVKLNGRWGRLHERQRSEDVSRRLRPREFRQARLWVADEVQQVLNPGQGEVLADYKACLLPPKNLKNPVRVGQAKDTSHLAKWLNRARRMKPAKLEKAIERMIAREEEHLGVLADGERRARRELLRAVVGEASEMSDTEFELSKGELSARITPVDRREALSRRIEELERQKGIPGKTARLLLNESMAQVLRMRYLQLGKPAVAARPTAVVRTD